MACPKDIVRAFLASKIAGKTTKLSNGMKSIASSCQEFMYIRLVPNIPDQQVIGSIEDVVQCHSQLNHAEIRSQVSTFHRNFFDDFTPNFFGQLLHLRNRQLT